MLAILRAIFKPQTPKESRLDTVHRLISYLHDVFKIAIKDRYLEFDPSFDLKDEFPSKARFYRENDHDSHMPAITKPEILKDFIKDLKNATYLDLQTKRAIYLQILSVNRPINGICEVGAYRL